MAESYSDRRGEKPPISTHPAFPAIVALWFAALLGLGSLVLPAALLETLAAMSGIGALLPAAEPPLGTTARTVVALTGAVVGAAFGMLLARQIARSQGQPHARLDAPERRPISAHDELGDEGLATEESGRSRYLDTALLRRRVELSEAPLPAQEQAMAEEHDLDPAAPPEENGEPEEFPPSEDAEPLEAPSPAPLQATEPTPAPALEEAEGGPALAAAAPPQLSVVAQGADAFESPIDDRPLEELGLVQLAARLGASIEKRRALKAAAPAAAPAAVPAQPAPEISASFEVAEAEEAARAMADFFGAAPAAEPIRQAPAEQEEEPAVAPSVPPAMRAVPTETEEDGEEYDEAAFAASFSLPPGDRVRGHGLSAADGDEEYGLEEDDTDEGEYSSLLAMKNPFSRHEEFVRMDDPELDDGGFGTAAAFPGADPEAAFDAALEARTEAAGADPAWPPAAAGKPTDSAAPEAAGGAQYDRGEAERDLRAALATLQRMNGSA